MSLSQETCRCQFDSEIAQVACFVTRYERFLGKRGISLSSSQRQTLLASRLRDLNLGEVSCRTVSEELAVSLILQSFISVYSKRHPNFAREIPLCNFSSKIDFFKVI